MTLEVSSISCEYASNSGEFVKFLQDTVVKRDHKNTAKDFDEIFDCEN